MTEEPPYKKWPVTADALTNGFCGRPFGELVLHHVNCQSLAQINAAAIGTVRMLPTEIQPLVMEWIDKNNSNASSAEFWKTDSADVLLSTIEQGKHFLAQRKIVAGEDALLNLFQIIVLNFAYTSHVEPESKQFIRKSMGVNYWVRIFKFFIKDPIAQMRNR